MPSEITLYNKEGKKTGTVKAPATLFAVPRNDAFIHQVYTAKSSNQRRHYAHAKTRAEVRGGGRKPWRQKGTGRARHGSIRSPLWVGGGVTFGPRNDKAFYKKVNKKMNRKAIAAVLSAKAQENNVYIIESLQYEEPKTRFGVDLLRALEVAGYSTLVYGTSQDEHFFRVFRNIPKTKPVYIENISIVDLLNSRFCLFSRSAFETLLSRYGETTKAPTKKSSSKNSKNIATTAR